MLKELPISKNEINNKIVQNIFKNKYYHVKYEQILPLLLFENEEKINKNEYI